MSYILNALRKSENERKAKEQSVNLETPTASESPLQNNRVIWIIIALVSINILILIYFLFFNSQPTSNTNTIIEPQTAKIEPQIKTHQKTVAKKPNPEKLDAIKTEDLQPIIKSTSPKINHQISISEMLEQRRVSKKSEMALASNKKNVPSTAARTKRQTKKPASSSTIKHVAITPESQQKKQPQPTKKAESIPFLREMPPEFRRRVPSLNINVFVYADEPDNRFVIIEMKKYRTGEETETGITIKDIKKDSLVLVFKNRIFQIKRP